MESFGCSNHEQVVLGHNLTLLRQRVELTRAILDDFLRNF